MNEQMTEKEFVPFGAEVYVSNLEQSLKFYRDQLGFKVLRIDESHHFVSFDFNSAIFMIEEKRESVQSTTGIVLRFVVADVKSYYSDVVKKGISIFKPLEIKDYGATRFYVKDPDGYQIKFTGK